MAAGSRPVTRRAVSAHRASSSRSGCGVLGGRVARVACCRSFTTSTRLGGRAWVGGGEVGQGGAQRRVDVSRAGGERGQQPVVQPLDLERGGAALPAGPPPPAERQAVGEVVGEQVVIQLGHGDGGVVQGPGVHRPPPAVRSLDLVRDHDVGVQVRVAGAGVPVVERRRQHPPRGHLRGPTGAGAGPQRGRFKVGQGVVDRGAVRLRDRLLRRRVGEGPQHAGGLRHGEREVEPGDRLRPRPGRLDLLDLGDHLGPPLRRQISREGGGLRGDPVREGGEGGVGAAEGLAVHRVPSGAEQGGHLLLGHDRAGGDPSGRVTAQAGQPRAGPPAGWVAGAGVVRGQRRGRVPGDVAAGRVPQQVLVAGTGGQPAHRHHRRPRRPVGESMP